MSLITIKTFLHTKKGYLKKSPKVTSERLDEPLELCEQALTEVKKEIALARVLKGLNELPLGDSGLGFKRLFFDIETSMYLVGTWRIGYGVNLSYEQVRELPKVICISYKWEHENKVHTITWDKNMDDKKALEDFIEIANQADELIAHNGDNFDIKWIRTRCAYHRIPMFPKYRTLDTLKKARANFRFPNNKLDTIVQFLGVGAKVKHEGIPLWFKCMQNDKEALKQMVKYCEGDIIALEDGYKAMQNYIIHNTHVGVHIGNAAYSCPNCGHNSGFHLHQNVVTPAGTIKRKVTCNNCNYTYEMSNKKYMML